MQLAQNKWEGGFFSYFYYTSTITSTPYFYYLSYTSHIGSLMHHSFEPNDLMVSTVFHYDAWNDRFSLKHQWTHVISW